MRQDPCLSSTPVWSHLKVQEDAAHTDEDGDAVCVFKGVSLAQAKDRGQLIFLEGLKDSLSALIPHETSPPSEAMDFLRYVWTSFSPRFFPLN